MTHALLDRARTISFLAAALMLLPSAIAAQYVPARGDGWETRRPAEVGMNDSGVQAAVDFAIAHEAPQPRDQERGQNQSFGRREPFGFGIGPFKVRSGAAGVIVRHGYIVAEWGDTRSVDMTHSVSKSFLSTTVGLALQDGLIGSIDDLARDYMAPVDLPPGDGEPGIDRVGFGKPDVTTLFNTEHNRQITWRHLLTQSSDWEGTLWGKPDWADRPDDDPSTWTTRARRTPGTVYEYNDTRVNLLALLTTSVWRQPLPQILKERVMDPIGASPTMALVRLRKLVDHPRWKTGTGRERWWALGWGHVHPCEGPSSLRAVHAAERALGRSAAHGRGVVRHGYDAVRRKPNLRLHELLFECAQQSGSEGLSQRAQRGLLTPRERHQPRLRRPGERPSGRGSVDSRTRHQRASELGHRLDPSNGSRRSLTRRSRPIHFRSQQAFPSGPNKPSRPVWRIR